MGLIESFEQNLSYPRNLMIVRLDDHHGLRKKRNHLGIKQDPLVPLAITDDQGSRTKVPLQPVNVTKPFNYNPVVATIDRPHLGDRLTCPRIRIESKNLGLRQTIRKANRVKAEFRPDIEYLRETSLK
jgi:hypothetical protein